MRILITNDDGINAPGLALLEAIAQEIAGPEGEVWVVAPAFEQSGVGHCISYSHPTMLDKFGPRRYAIQGSPADCVLAALYVIMADDPPDLVLSGVNRGNNAAENVIYSGTVGAAIEAAIQGVPAIALSQFNGPRNRHLDNPFDAAAVHGVETIRALLDQGLWKDETYRVFYNVNFPPCPATDVRGRRVTSQGHRPDTSHGVVEQVSPTGRTFLWVKGGPQDSRTPDGTDNAANLDDYISISPLRADLTAEDMLGALRERLDT